MKKIATLFLLWICSICTAQIKGDMSINWTSKSPNSMGDRKVNIPQFNPTNFQYDGSSGRLYFIFQIPLETEINENSLQISNIVYENIEKTVELRCVQRNENSVTLLSHILKERT
jgi:hypothetical protein